MYFSVTIDTEEDNWDNFRDRPTLENIKNIPLVQEIFDQLEVRPTYLITYPVAKDGNSVKILKKYLLSQKCEIGAHLHPWNTPPLELDFRDEDTMLNNLAAHLQMEKLSSLHQQIMDSFGIKPLSFRAGRYGINHDLAKNILNLDYIVESSITPFLDWRYFHGPDFSKISRLNPYRFSSNNIFEEDLNGELYEAPLTTGFLQSNFQLANSLFLLFRKLPFKFLKLNGLLATLGLLNKIRLTPEGYQLEQLKHLIYTLLQNKIKFFNLSFHSNTLLPGSTPFVASAKDLDIFLRDLREVITYLKNKNMDAITLSEIPSAF
jgi:hypothetical protein